MFKNLEPLLLATLSFACLLSASPASSSSLSSSVSTFPNGEGGTSVQAGLLASLDDADLAAAPAIDSRNLSDDQSANGANTNNISNSNTISNNDVTVLPNHVCSREETYVEQVKTPSMEPVRIRTSNWCLEIPPRCSNYKTEMREVLKVQNLTKTRRIRFCCDGYAGNISVNDTVCKPVCRGGCGRGYCQKPDLCSCDAGYTGKHCTQRCDHDHWGEECRNLCRCENGAVCDNKSGLCHCTTGWTGELCELPCPEGTFGVMCRKSCDCSDRRCHPQSGECVTTSRTTSVDTPADSGQSPIDAVKPELNATHAMIQTLNSTIANITHNLDRIAKNIVNIATTTSEPVTFLLAAADGDGDATTPAGAGAVPEVIVIKRNEAHHQTPKIIVHQPGGDIGGDAGSSASEVIHVITNWQQQQQHHLHPNGTTTLDLAANGAGQPPQPPPSLPPHGDHDSTLLTTLFAILLLIMVAIAIGFLYVYRRYHWQKQRVEAALAERTALGRHLPPPATATTMVTGTGTGTKGFLKPLPDLPAFTQMVHNKIDGISHIL